MSDSSDHIIAISIGDAEVGRIDLRTLPGQAQLDIEDIYESVTPAKAMVQWLVAYAGADRHAVRAALGKQHVSVIIDLALDIQRAIAQGLAIKKKSTSLSL